MLFCNICVCCTFIFVLCCFFFLFIIWIIREFFYYLFQVTIISCWFIFSYKSVYYIFILNVFVFSLLFIYTNITYLINLFILIIQVLFKKIFHHRCGCVIWSFIYQLLIGIQFFSVPFFVIYLCNTSSFSVSDDTYLTSSFTFV